MPSYSLASNVGVDGEPRLRGDDDVRRMVMVKMKMMGGGGSCDALRIFGANANIIPVTRM